MSRKLVSSLSQPAGTTNLNIFQVPPTSLAIENTKWLRIHPSNPINDTGPYVFHLAPIPQYLSMQNNFLVMEAQIKRDDDTDMQPNDQFCPINAIGKTLWKQVVLSLNNQDVYDSGNMYHYKSYLETHLNYSPSVKETQLVQCDYVQDVPEAQNNNVDDLQNVGVAKRCGTWKRSRWVETISTIHTSLLTQDKYLVSNVDMRLTLSRNTNAFALLAYGAPQQTPVLKIRSLVWFVQCIEAIPSVNVAIERHLMNESAKYAVKRVHMKHTHISGGATESGSAEIVTGQLPSRIIFGCVETAAVNGSYQLSPFNFKHKKISEISITAANQQIPYHPIETDFAENRFGRAYHFFMENIGIGNENRTNGITPYLFKNGSCLWCFDLTEDYSADDGNYNLIREGSIIVNMKFRDALPAEGCDIVYYCEYQSLMEIDSERNTHMDYAV